MLSQQSKLLSFRTRVLRLLKRDGEPGDAVQQLGSFFKLGALKSKSFV